MYLQKSPLKISLDLDGTIFDWENHFKNKFGTVTKESDITKIVRNKLVHDSEFWLTQPIINFPNFVPSIYCTARIISKYLIKKQLEINNLPKAPVYQILGYSLSKYHHIKAGGCHLHIDDSLSVFKDLNSKGIPCLLYNNPGNQDWGPVGRIYSLDINEIEDAYRLFINTIFPNFKKLL